MKYKVFVRLMLCLVTTIIGCSKPSVGENEAKQAMDVIKRYAEGQSLPVEIAVTLDKQNGCDVYETSVKNGTLYINASSGVAACRGFYEYVKAQKAGIYSWSRNRLQWPVNMEDSPVHTVISPYKHHYYFNTVTYGYTMPYWDWARWEKEIDWMALHGMDISRLLARLPYLRRQPWCQVAIHMPPA